jgi:hypothetical protein
MSTTDIYNDDGEIQQNHNTGPGWFLKIAYVVIALFCIYYGFTHWSWQSSYQQQQAQIQAKLQGK